MSNTFQGNQSYTSAWRELVHYKEKHIRPNRNNRFISISQDNPIVTPMEQRRFYIGVLAYEETKPGGKFSVRKIPGGMYAVFCHKGSYADLPELYQTIYEQWLPQSDYLQNNPLTFEIYLNAPGETPIEELLTDIYIPIENK